MKLVFTLLVALLISVGLWFLLEGGSGGGRGIARLAERGEGVPGVDGGPVDPTAEGALERLEAAAKVRELDAAQDAPEVAPTATITARAQTADGRPVANAWLCVRHAPWARAVGDASGELRLEVPAEDFERFVAQQDARTIQPELGAPRHAAHIRMSAVAEGETRLELGVVVLEPGADLFGRVVDANGLGVERARVVFTAPLEAAPDAAEPAHQGPPELRFSGWAPSRYELATSGPGGAFRFDGLRPGYGSVWARGETSLWSWSEPIGLRAGEEAGEVVLVLREVPERTLRGRLVDPEGRAVAGRPVRCSGPQPDGGWRHARSDGEGRFAFALEEPGEYALRAETLVWEWEPAELEGLRPGTHDVVLAYSAARWLEVSVHDREGRALPHGRVSAVLAEGAAVYALSRSTSTLDADGRGRLRRPSNAFRVLVEAPGFRNALLGPFEPARFPEPLVVTLESVPAIVGRVFLPDGSPAAGASVALRRGPPHAQGLPRLTHQGWMGDGEPFVYAAHPKPKASARCDAQGRFRLPLPGIDLRSEGEREGSEVQSLGYTDSGATPASAANVGGAPTWFVHVALEGHATHTFGPRAFEGEQDFELELALPRAGTLVGRLVLEEGGEPRGFLVRVADGLAQVASSSVAPDGSFRFEHLHPGPWQVRVFEPDARFYHHAGLATEAPFVPDVEVLAGETVDYELRFRARPQARLLGHLLLDGVAPGPWRAEVRIRRASASSILLMSSTLDPDGRFEVTSEPGAEVAFDLLRRRGDAPVLTVSAKVELLAGDNPWSLDLATASLEGFVEPARPEAPTRGFGGEFSYVSQRDGITLRVRFRPDSTGRFGPLTVPAGAGTLRGPSPSLREVGPIRAELELRPGERRTLDLR